MPKVVLKTVIISVVIYAILVGIHFDPEVRATFVKAFGPKPFGLPVTVVVIIAESLLFLPMPWVFFHLMHVMTRMMRDRAERGSGAPISLSSFLLEGGRGWRRNSDLRRSYWIVLGGLLYFVLICAGWITFTAVRGI